MTGAELRAWRERLGKDEVWGAAALDTAHEGAPHSAGLGHATGQGAYRLHTAEKMTAAGDDVAHLRAVLSAALEAEERAQAAERGPVEPVCPEGVTVSPQDNGCVIRITGRAASSLFVGPVGTVSTLFSGVEAPPALLEYAAALSRYRAAVHAASDRQRKLDAVKAAEEARDAARRARDVAEDALTEAIKAHVAARREAGL